MIRATTSRLLAAGTLAQFGVLALACILLAACGSALPAGPSKQASLRLTARISRSVVPAGETATITFQLDNPGKDTVKLTFSSGCDVLPYIARATGVVVYPPGGYWGCTAMIMELSLPPGGSKTREIQVRAAATGSSSPYADLAAGDYSAYATVDSYSCSLRSDPIRFTVQ